MLQYISKFDPKLFDFDRHRAHDLHVGMNRADGDDDEEADALRGALGERTALNGDYRFTDSDAMARSIVRRTLHRTFE